MRSATTLAALASVFLSLAACGRDKTNDAKPSASQVASLSGGAAPPAPPPPPKPVRIVAGWEKFCALMSDGNVKCWGANGEGELGPSEKSLGVPVTLAIKDVKDLALGGEYVCALTDAWKCWGKGPSGIIDGLESYQSTEPVAVQGVENIASLSTMLDHTCALTKAGGVSCWGQGYQSWMGAKDFLKKPADIMPSGAAALQAGISTVGCARMTRRHRPMLGSSGSPRPTRSRQRQRDVRGSDAGGREGSR